MPLVSVGDDVLKPYALRAEPMDAVLAGIASGRWGEQVEAVRKLLYQSPEQSALKKRLPFWTPAGLFEHRRSWGLIRHSGHVAVDLDALGIDGTTRAIQTAVADPHCKCAFRSASGHGARLIFPCPPCGPEAHKLVFDRVAEHVTAQYGLEVDLSGSDVARASFVSFDHGLWLNLHATMLPGLAELVRQSQDQTPHKESRSLCVVKKLTEGDINTLAYGLGESRAPYARKPDGTCLTHEPIRDLARDLVVRFQKHGLPLTLPEIERALNAWFKTGKRKGMKFRNHPETYRHELIESVRCVRDARWLGRVVCLWTRWTREPDFPMLGSSDERLEYAIRRHCAETKDASFYLSARDAATITGTCFKSANQTLHRLVKAGVLERDGKRLGARDAQGYRLRSMT